ncbi:protein TolA [Malassezia restricta CBS 7877]|uniref:Protein TolA n=1 Tax=Malassezia restricta (strain ATCC 96810 / NBRC 103918 / CBS 7877) TaxID=425264 RepID=A0A3G2S5D7_MALR7|nr:protein TolA [Malassezia restricta CBS 7877]
MSELVPRSHAKHGRFPKPSFGRSNKQHHSLFRPMNDHRMKEHTRHEEDQTLAAAREAVANAGIVPAQHQPKSARAQDLSRRANSEGASMKRKPRQFTNLPVETMLGEVPHAPASVFAQGGPATVPFTYHEPKNFIPKQSRSEIAREEAVRIHALRFRREQLNADAIREREARKLAAQMDEEPHVVSESRGKSIFIEDGVPPPLPEKDLANDEPSRSYLTPRIRDTAAMPSLLSSEQTTSVVYNPKPLSYLSGSTLLTSSAPVQPSEPKDTTSSVGENLTPAQFAEMTMADFSTVRAGSTLPDYLSKRPEVPTLEEDRDQEDAKAAVPVSETLDNLRPSDTDVSGRHVPEIPESDVTLLPDISTVSDAARAKEDNMAELARKEADLARQEAILARLEAQKAREEAERVRREAEQIRREAEAARAAAVEAREIEVKLVEEARRAENARKAEEAKRAEEARKEEARKAEEAKKEEARKAEEAKKEEARKVEAKSAASVQTPSTSKAADDLPPYASPHRITHLPAYLRNGITNMMRAHPAKPSSSPATTTKLTSAQSFSSLPKSPVDSGKVAAVPPKTSIPAPAEAATSTRNKVDQEPSSKQKDAPISAKNEPTKAANASAPVQRVFPQLEIVHVHPKGGSRPAPKTTVPPSKPSKDEPSVTAKSFNAEKAPTTTPSFSSLPKGELSSRYGLFIVGDAEGKPELAKPAKFHGDLSNEPSAPSAPVLDEELSKKTPIKPVAREANAPLNLHSGSKLAPAIQNIGYLKTKDSAPATEETSISNNQQSRNSGVDSKQEPAPASSNVVPREVNQSTQENLAQPTSKAVDNLEPAQAAAEPKPDATAQSAPSTEQPSATVSDKPDLPSSKPKEESEPKLEKESTEKAVNNKAEETETKAEQELKEDAAEPTEDQPGAKTDNRAQRRKAQKEAKKAKKT